jgi:LCP family protein required for cell wall assembly
MSQQPTKKSGLRTFLMVMCVLLSLILILAITAVFALKFGILNRLNYYNNSETISREDAESIAMEDAEQINPDDSHPLFDQNDIEFENGIQHQGQGDHIVNFMLVGQDAREGEGRQRSDSMMLVTFNKKKGTITLTSFMRDEYVQIPGYGATKLCHAYAYGGMDLLNQTLYNHYGVEINGNFEVVFSGFEDIINYLGGVDIELTSAEAKYLREAGHSYVKKGMCHLRGNTALLYARLRSIDNDYNRAERQRNVMMSLLDAYKGLDKSEMLTLLYDILPYLTTNMTQTDIVNYAMDLFPMLSESEATPMRLPVDGTFDTGFIKVSEGQKLWCQLNIDFEANRKILDEIFAEE